MATQIEIVNKALSLVSQPPLLNIDDPTPNAETCKTEWPFSYSAVLRAYRWPFALRRVHLARSNEAAVFEYKYKYVLPADNVRIAKVNLGHSATGNWDTYDFEDTYDLDRYKKFTLEGNFLLTNYAAVNLVYVSSETPPSWFDPDATDALAYKLASSICVKITSNMELKSQLYTEYTIALNKARHVWSTENHPIYPKEGTWLPSRGNGGPRWQG